MGVIRRFVWGTMALGVLAILGGTSALAFTGDPEGAGSAERTTQDGSTLGPAEQTSPGFSAVSVPTPDPNAVWRWMAPHTVPVARR